MDLPKAVQSILSMLAPGGRGCDMMMCIPTYEITYESRLYGSTSWPHFKSCHGCACDVCLFSFLESELPVSDILVI
jgi:hypothetical protein